MFFENREYNLVQVGYYEEEARKILLMLIRREEIYVGNNVGDLTARSTNLTNFLVLIERKEESHKSSQFALYVACATEHFDPFI